ncbi:MAG: glycosyltransferase family 2 protein [Candidatus Woesearchaeota archaeon]
MKLSIIIVNYNTTWHLVNCLESIVKFINRNDFEIIVVDNNSTELLPDDLETRFNALKIIRIDKNLGFGSANNIGIKQAQGDYVLFINPDVSITDGSVKILIDYMEVNNDTAVVAPVLYKPNGELDYYYTFLPSFYSVLMIQISRYNDAKLMKQRMFRYLDYKVSMNKPFNVQQVMGACMLTRKSVLDSVGGFDEAFFLYQEETDWQLRVSKKGWKIMMIPQAKVIHYHHASTEKIGKNFISFHWFRSLILYYVKNFNFLSRTILRITMMFALIARGIKYTVIYFNNKKQLKDIIKMLFKLLKLNLTSRQKIMKCRYIFNVN